MRGGQMRVEGQGLGGLFQPLRQHFRIGVDDGQIQMRLRRFRLQFGNPLKEGNCLLRFAQAAFDLGKQRKELAVVRGEAAGSLQLDFGFRNTALLQQRLTAAERLIGGRNSLAALSSSRGQQAQAQHTWQHTRKNSLAVRHIRELTSFPCRQRTVYLSQRVNPVQSACDNPNAHGAKPSNCAGFPASEPSRRDRKHCGQRPATPRFPLRFADRDLHTANAFPIARIWCYRRD